LGSRLASPEKGEFVMVKITLTHAQTGQAWGPFENSAIIGRDAQCDLTVPGRLVSKVHCKLEPSGNGWALVDLDSTNGTLLEAERITRARVADGQTIVVGDVPLRLSFQSTAVRPSVAPRPAPSSVAPAAPATGSLWEQATTAAAAAAAVAPAKEWRIPSLRSLTKGNSNAAVVAALLGAILLCAAWSAYCVAGRSPATPRVPRQLAPIDNDPSV
jgi:predicted component of type VI protein secretion system